jgi:hypothetical protein
MLISLLQEISYKMARIIVQTIHANICIVFSKMLVSYFILPPLFAIYSINLIVILNQMEDKRKHDQFEGNYQFDEDTMELPIISLAMPLINECSPTKIMKAPYLDQSIAILNRLSDKHPVLKPLLKLIRAHAFSTHCKITLDIIDLLEATSKIMLSQIAQATKPST